MITKSFIQLLMTGQINLATANIKLMLTQYELPLTDSATSATGIIADPLKKVVDANIPTGFVDAELLVDSEGVSLVINPRVIKMLAPHKVGGVLVFIEGVHGNISDPIVSYVAMPYDSYYNIAMLSSGERIISFK